MYFRGKNLFEGYATWSEIDIYDIRLYITIIDSNSYDTLIEFNYKLKLAFPQRTKIIIRLFSRICVIRPDPLYTIANKYVMIDNKKQQKQYCFYDIDNSRYCYNWRTFELNGPDCYDNVQTR